MKTEDDKVTVKVPGSIANLGPGFDVFALALDEPYDLLTIETIPDKNVSLKVTGIRSGTIPIDPELNTAGQVGKILLKKIDPSFGFKIAIHKGIPHSFGLGSSGADAAAAAYALNHLLGLELSDNDLISLAAQGEIAASGVAHADNVSASLLGGFTIVRSYDPMHVLSYDPPDNLGLCIAIPEIEPPKRKTALARKVLPDNVPLRQVTHTLGHAASLVYGMLTRDVHIIGSAMNDGIVEPVRSKFVPGYERVKAGALKEGAAGVVICGAGPSLAAFFDTNETDPRPISERMVSGFKEAGIESKAVFTAPGKGIKRVADART